MLTLAIDCATEACSVALFENMRLVAGDFRMLGRGHAEQLVPMIASLPDKGRAGRIAVALGPGSFTGVRVGLAAARALAFAWHAELVGYPTLALVAAMARNQRPGPTAVAMTGGHGEWFMEVFDAAGASAQPLASLTPAEAVSACTERQIAGSQAEALVAARGNEPGWQSALPLWPDARELSLLPETSFIDDVHPIYGRKPDARLPQIQVEP